MSRYSDVMRSITQLTLAAADYENENNKLRSIIEGQQVCADDDADAKDCPLYDESEPYRCKKERLMEELGL